MIKESTRDRVLIATQTLDEGLRNIDEYLPDNQGTADIDDKVVITYEVYFIFFRSGQNASQIKGPINVGVPESGGCHSVWSHGGLLTPTSLGTWLDMSPHPKPDYKHHRPENRPKCKY
jgi:hypothetical protein